jgi:hypothetical protein
MTGFSTEKRVQIVGSLVVANSIRAIVPDRRGEEQGTKLLVDLGSACEQYQRLSWSTSPAYEPARRDPGVLVGQPEERPYGHCGTFGWGDVWTWTAVCADTKLVRHGSSGSAPSTKLGRSSPTFRAASRSAGQLTADGLKI